MIQSFVSEKYDTSLLFWIHVCLEFITRSHRRRPQVEEEFACNALSAQQQSGHYARFDDNGHDSKLLGRRSERDDDSSEANERGERACRGILFATIPHLVAVSIVLHFLSLSLFMVIFHLSLHFIPCRLSLRERSRRSTRCCSRRKSSGTRSIGCGNSAKHS